MSETESARSPTCSPSGGRSSSGCARRASSRSRTASRTARRSRRCGSRTRASSRARRPSDRYRVAGRPDGAARARQGRLPRPARRHRPDPGAGPRGRAGRRGLRGPARPRHRRHRRHRGTVFASKRGELSLRADAWELLSKSLRPPPEKFHGLEDVETRYRRRELDLMANEETRELS